jgi:hypothetical protein
MYVVSYGKGPGEEGAVTVTAKVLLDTVISGIIPTWRSELRGKKCVFG